MSVPAANIDSEVSSRLLEVLEQVVRKRLRRLEQPIDSRITGGQRRNYAERLNKTVSSWTLRHDSPEERSIWRSARIHSLIKPEIARKLSEAALGVELNAVHGSQIVANTHGDYAGPHNDHHPELPNLRRGYVDFHFYVCNPYVRSQYMVYEEKGHLKGMMSLAQPCGINIYRLPFWHYTTPLQGDPAYRRRAARWIVMYTFDFKGL